MISVINTIRHYDYGLFLDLYRLNHSNYFWSEFFYFFARYGILIVILSMVYLIWNKRINALICTLFAAFFASVVDVLIYLTWNRPRPFITHADITATIDRMRIDASSFPSSHTYVAFAFATSVYLYGHKKLGTALYVIAICIALSRIANGLHYPSDVLGGALLGVASGIIAYIIVQKSEKYWNQ